jgi:hypothetical protein
MKILQRQMPALVLVMLVSLTLSSCKTPTLEAGGPYTDPVLYQTDRSILDGVKALNDFVALTEVNSVYLTEKVPQAMALAVQIRTNTDMWEIQAYKARSAYASAKQAYDVAVAASKANNTPAPDGTVVTTTRDKLNGAIAVIQNLLPIIADFRKTIVIKS